MELPILECAICGQGVHKPCWLNLATIPTNNTDIDENTDAELFRSLYNPLNLPGMFYICHACQPNTIPTDSDGDNKRKKKKVSKDAAPSTSSQNRPEESPETETEDIVFLSTQDANNEEVNTRETKYQNQNQNQPNDTTSRTRICRFYKNGDCKFGLKGKECKFTHPKM